MFNPIDYLQEIKNNLYLEENKLSTKLDLILKELQNMSTELDALTTQVQANADLLDSAVVLINGIAARITAAGTDPAKLSALTVELKTKDTALAAAVLANTPVVVEGALWVASDIYSKGDTVLGSDSNTYTSNAANNSGNDPTVAASTFWTIVPVQTVTPAPVVK